MARWTGSVSQPRDGESPSEHVARIVREGIEREGGPVLISSRDVNVAAGHDCPDCRGGGTCDNCG